MLKNLQISQFQNPRSHENAKIRGGAAVLKCRTYTLIQPPPFLYFHEIIFETEIYED